MADGGAINHVYPPIAAHTTKCVQLETHTQRAMGLSSFVLMMWQVSGDIIGSLHFAAASYRTLSYNARQTIEPLPYHIFDSSRV